MTTESDTALTGAAYELASAGYVPMPDTQEEKDPEAIGNGSASLREAAAQRMEATDDVIVRGYTGPDGAPVAPNEAVSLARASRDYASATAAERLIAESETSKALAERVDTLRAEAFANDPEAAGLYSFQPPQARAEGTAFANAEAGESGRDQSAEPAVPGLDPEIEKALQHPQVRHAIEEQLGEAEKTRQSYLAGLAAATQIVQVSFLSQFPELAAVFRQARLRECGADHQAMTGMQAADIRAIVVETLAEQQRLRHEDIDAVVLKAIEATLVSFGLDEDRKEARADFQHLRRWRRSVEQAQSYTFKAVITVIATGFVGAVWLGIKTTLGK